MSIETLNGKQTLVLGGIYEFVSSVMGNAEAIAAETKIMNKEDTPEEAKKAFHVNLNGLKWDYWNKTGLITESGAIVEGATTDTAVHQLRHNFYDSMREHYSEELVNETLVFVDERLTLLDDCSKAEEELIKLLGPDAPTNPNIQADGVKTFGPFNVAKLEEFSNHPQATDDMKKEYAALVEEMKEKNAVEVTFVHTTTDGQLNITKDFKMTEEEETVIPTPDAMTSADTTTENTIQ